MKSYLFYDVETSGLNPAFDQVLTFACIRTDLELNEISRETITVRLRTDIVPSPGAFLTHGLTPDDLKKGVSEYQAALRIHELLNRPGTVSVGYNSLGFDDEFLRFLFYRNLLDPYSHQYANGCSRMDILPIATVFRVFHSRVLNWPERDGKPSLKLDLIAEANQIETSGRAHEAMSDVEALVALSRIFYTQKEIWEYCLNFFNKTRDTVRINSFESDFEIAGQTFATAIIVSASFGPDNYYLAPVVNIGPSSVYKNQNLWLRLDSGDLSWVEEEGALDDTFVTRKRAGDALIVLPPLPRFWSRLAETSRSKAFANMDKIRENPGRFFDFITYHAKFQYPYIPDMDTDAALYQDGFFSRDEKKEIQLFHDAAKGEKPGMTDQIVSPRVKALAERILIRNFDAPAEKMPGSNGEKGYWDILRSKSNDAAIVGFRNDTKLCVEEALDELNNVQKEISDPAPAQKEMISWLGRYIENL